MNEIVAQLGSDQSEVAANVAAYMERFGHLDGPSPESAHEFSAVVARFQHNMGLAATGELDRLTVDLILQPRCGVPDHLVDAMGVGDTSTRPV